MANLTHAREDVQPGPTATCHPRRGPTARLHTGPRRGPRAEPPAAATPGAGVKRKPWAPVGPADRTRSGQEQKGVEKKLGSWLSLPSAPTPPRSSSCRLLLSSARAPSQSCVTDRLPERPAVDRQCHDANGLGTTFAVARKACFNKWIATFYSAYSYFLLLLLPWSPRAIEFARLLARSRAHAAPASRVPPFLCLCPAQPTLREKDRSSATSLRTLPSRLRHWGHGAPVLLRHFVGVRSLRALRAAATARWRRGS